MRHGRRVKKKEKKGREVGVGRTGVEVGKRVIVLARDAPAKGGEDFGNIMKVSREAPPSAAQ